MAEQLGEFTDRSLQMNSLTRVHALIIVIIPACLHAQIAQKWRPLASTLKDAQSRARLSAVFRHVGQVNTEKSECSRETSRHRGIEYLPLLNGEFTGRRYSCMMRLSLGCMRNGRSYVSSTLSSTRLKQWVGFRKALPPQMSGGVLEPHPPS